MIGCGLGIALLLDRSVRAEGILWWEPPAHITKADRFGKTVDQVLAMGSGWSDFAYERVQAMNDADKYPNLVVNRVDGINIVWGACLRDRNDRLLAQLSAQRRRTLRAVRRHMFRFAMACIGLEDVLAGGGTYAIHFPRYMWCDEEDALYRMITHKPGHAMAANTEHRLRARLHYYTSLKKAPNTLLYEGPAHLSEIHTFAKVAAKEYGRLAPLEASVDSNDRKHIQAFEMQFLYDYLGIRGADGTPVRWR